MGWPARQVFMHCFPGSSARGSLDAGAAALGGGRSCGSLASLGAVALVGFSGREDGKNVDVWSTW